MIDRVITRFDKALRTLFVPAATVRGVPGEDLPDPPMSAAQRRHLAALMRINHCGEVCAQALYEGQAVSAKDAAIRQELEQAGCEETEHLAWTAQRIAELGGRKSLLNPLWYAGSFAIGVFAGTLGERWNLGFLAETERQVEAHLSAHLDRFPAEDERSRAILLQMRSDEIRHAELATHLGAQELPAPIKSFMKFTAWLMTTTTYRI